MDYETQNAIDYAKNDLLSDLRDERYDRERAIEDLRRDISRLEERLDSLKSELRSESEE